MVDTLVEAEVTNLAPETFVALDINTDHLPEGVPSRVVGTVVRVTDTFVVLLPADAEKTIIVDRTMIEKAYWAPMGYRP